MTELVDAHGRPRVVVTGMGVKTPAGIDVDSFWATVRAGRGTAETIQRFDPSELPVRFAGEVLDFDPAAYFGPKEVRRIDRVTQLGLRRGRRRHQRRRRARRRPEPRARSSPRTGVGGLETHGGERGDLPRAGREPGQPVLRAR